MDKVRCVLDTHVYSAHVARSIIDHCDIRGYNPDRIHIKDTFFKFILLFTVSSVSYNNPYPLMMNSYLYHLHLYHSSYSSVKTKKLLM